MSGTPVPRSPLKTSKLIKSFKAVLLGPPGSFKSQLVNKAASDLQISIIPVRERINENIQKDSKFGKLAKKCLEENILVPDKIMLNFISKEILECEVKNNSWLISGFPVTEVQTKLFWEHVKLHRAYLVQFPEDVLVQNLAQRYKTKNGEKDESSTKNLEDIQKIINNYAQISKPMLEFYKEMNVLKSIYSNTFETMWEKLQKAIVEVAEENLVQEKKKN